MFKFWSVICQVLSVFCKSVCLWVTKNCSSVSYRYEDKQAVSLMSENSFEIVFEILITCNLLYKAYGLIPWVKLPDVT